MIKRRRLRTFHEHRFLLSYGLACSLVRRTVLCRGLWGATVQDAFEETAEQRDVAGPGPGSDPPEDVARNVPEDVRALYEVHSYKGAATILGQSCRDEFSEILDALRAFRITRNDIVEAGGNETRIPKIFSGLLRPKGWLETRVRGDLLVTMHSVAGEGKKRVVRTETITRTDFVDGHKIDYVKRGVAFDLEWNSKDQTFDRDLYAFRSFSDCGVIRAAVLVTRSAALNGVFETLGVRKDAAGNPLLHNNGRPKLVKEKYGASTTWMGKLLYRLNAGRNGGCPVLVFGITPRLISDLEEGDA